MFSPIKMLLWFTMHNQCAGILLLSQSACYQTTLSQLHSLFTFYTLPTRRSRRKQMKNAASPALRPRQICAFFSDLSVILHAYQHVTYFCFRSTVRVRPWTRNQLADTYWAPSTFPACAAVAVGTPAPACSPCSRCVRLRLIRNECTKVMCRINGTACCHWGRVSDRGNCVSWFRRKRKNSKVQVKGGHKGTSLVDVGEWKRRVIDDFCASIKERGICKRIWFSKIRCCVKD